LVNPSVLLDDDADEAKELRRVDDAEDNNSTALNILEQWERINVAVITLGKFEECLVVGREERKALFKGFRA